MLRRSYFVALALACSALPVIPSSADGAAPLPAPAHSSSAVPLHVRIDQRIGSGSFAHFDAGPASDDEFLRRAYLDLVGTIPTVDVTRAFLADRSANKRQVLIDRLLASPAHPRHLANVFDVMLMERRGNRQVSSAEWREYLRTSLAANKPWDVLVREILSADGADPKTRPAAKFLLERGELNLMTRDIGRLLLGMNLQCAQCHDHPRIEEYRQDHYYGLMAFLGRTSIVTDRNRKVSVLSEKADGESTFQSVFDPAKVTKTALPRVPNGPAIKDEPVEKGKAYLVPPAAGVASVPRYSRRAQLAKNLARGDYEPFRRNIANRLWALMMGRGLVHPLDLDHSGNPPSHPELLDELAADLVQRKFEMRGFLRELALSQTYGRSSAVRPGIDPKDAPLYSSALIKPLSAEQLAWSLMQATGLTDATRLSLGKKATEEQVYTRLAGNVTAFVRTFGGPPGPPQNFEASIDQALFLANGQLIRSWLTPRPGNLTDRLSKLNSPEEIAEELYLSVLTRLPASEERQEVADFLEARTKGRPQDRPAALQDLAWALLASAEFRFNH